jgi:hypothetical protein
VLKMDLLSGFSPADHIFSEATACKDGAHATPKILSTQPTNSDVLCKLQTISLHDIPKEFIRLGPNMNKYFRKCFLLAYIWICRLASAAVG